MEKKRVVGYIRMGRASGFTSSIKSGIAFINETVSKHTDWELVGIYADEGVSGKGQRRCEFERMLQDAEKHQFDGIVVKDLSRFTRDYTEAYKTLLRLNELGITVFFINESVSSDDEAFKQRMEILSALKEKERDILSAMREKRKE